MADKDLTTSDDQDFALHPTSVAEARADKSSSAADWAPRDALIKLLREIDSGETKVDVVVIAYRIVHDDETHSAGYLNASPEEDVALGVVARAVAMMTRRRD